MIADYYLRIYMGIGVAFPKYYTLYGDCEYEIGMWEFLNRAKDIF